MGLTEKHWRLESVMHLFMLLLLGFGLGGVLLQVFIASRKGATIPAELSLIIGAVSLYGTAIPALIWFVRKHGTTFINAFGLTRGRVGSAVAWGVLTTLGALPIVYVLQWLSVLVLKQFGIAPDVQSNVRMLVQGSPQVRSLIALIAVGLAPAVEEIVFRGILFSSIRDLKFPRAAYWVTSILFGLSHFNRAAFIPLTVFGAMLAWVYERSGNLLAPWVAHVCFNLAPFIMIALGITQLESF